MGMNESINHSLVHIVSSTLQLKGFFYKNPTGTWSSTSEDDFQFFSRALRRESVSPEMSVL